MRPGGGSKNVTVELFNDSSSPSPACAAYASPVASQTLTYVSGDGGRKTLTGDFNLGSAYGRLRCRVRDTNESPTVYGCSTDTFSVRPQSFSSVTSADAGADGAGTSTSATPAIKAGKPFTLNANTGKAGYNGTPKIDAAKIEWPGVPVGGRAAPGVGTLGGLFTVPASALTGNGASGTGFTYSEVGYFRFQPQGVYDDTFAAASGDITNGDCTDNFSNTRVGGKYGCKIGNAVATNHFGRFIPDRFVAAASGGGAACGGFSYMSQPFASTLNMTVEARNGSNAKTQNYAGAFAKGVVSLQMEDANSGAAIPAARLNVINTPAWSSGLYSMTADRFLRDAAGPDGAYDALDIGLSVTDEAALAAAARPYLMTRDMDAANTSCTIDLTGLSTTAGVCTATKLVSAAKVRYGRLWLGNAYGSERSALAVPYETQYWNGRAFVRNTLDNCTALVASNVALANKQGGLTAYTGPVTVGAIAGGAGSLSLSAPGTGVAGSVDLLLSLGSTGSPSNCPNLAGATAATLSYLSGKWCGSAFDRDPVARATFGIKAGNRQIYLREGY